MNRCMALTVISHCLDFLGIMIIKLLCNSSPQRQGLLYFQSSYGVNPKP